MKLSRENSLYLAKIAALALVYLAAAKFGLSLAFSVEQVSTVWPPTGIALAALLLMGYKYWPAIFAGAFVANMLTNVPAAVAAGIAIGNTLEAVVGAYLLRRVVGFDNALTRVRDALGLVVLAGMVSTSIAATIGTASLISGGLVSPGAFSATWLTWWVGDMMGAVIITPLLLVYLHKGLRSSIQGRLVEAGMVFASILVVATLIFAQPPDSIFPMPYVLFPFMIWAVLRFAQIGAVTATITAATTAVWGTINGLGPFAGSGSTESDLILLQTYLLVVSTTSLLMAVAVYHRQRVEKILKLQAEELKESNRRATNILEKILDDSDEQLSKAESENNHRIITGS
ncbi:MAG TPA: MASE1 domain-containing protein [Candidatus Dormibacteraeota bacterium]|nr:MASE1 domain-containing protein [Candidatus Dormibacteraeota bacterium]